MYATVEEFKRLAGGLQSDTHDVIVESILNAAEQTINRFCNRPEGFIAESDYTDRYFPGNGKSHIRIEECVSIQTVSVKDSASDTDYTDWDTPTTNMAGDGDWIAFWGPAEDPDFNPLSHWRPYTRLMIDPNGSYSSFTSGAYAGLRGFSRDSIGKRFVPTVKVSAKWGFSVTVPPDIKTACIMQTARWYKRLQSSMADTLAGPELGMLMFRQVIDPDIALILKQGRYIRREVG